MNKPTPETAKLRERAVAEMFERVKEILRPESGPEAELKRLERMIETQKLMVESLAPDAGDPKIQRQIRSLKRDIALWEKWKAKRIGWLEVESAKRKAEEAIREKREKTRKGIKHGVHGEHEGHGADRTEVREKRGLTRMESQ